MDFFERQDHARRLTRRLVVMFALAVVVVVLTVYLVAALLVIHLSPAAGNLWNNGRWMTGQYDVSARDFPHQFPAPWAPPGLWQPQVFLWVTLGTLSVILLGSLYKISELSSGGEGVALMLGGRAIDPQTTDLAERRLLNVVEEMALASGIPVPPVFVMDHERGINAFAAGHRPGDAVVAVSAGCLRYLSREELQGVMGHEFSHVLNGDMRLNLRLVGVVYGILVLAIVGYYVMRSAAYGSDRRGTTAYAFIIGLVLVVLGYLGVFLGNLIKAAVNRQREFLADASAVQFTRYPGGIAGALKKIGGLADGSRIREAHAHEVSHMFFGDAFAGSFFNLLATHPPLAARIRALEPDFDGRFPEVRPVPLGDEAAAGLVPSPSGRGQGEGGAAPPRAARPIGRPMAAVPPIAVGTVVLAALAGGAGMQADATGSASAAPASDPQHLIRHVGAPQTEHIEHAGRMVAAMPEPLVTAAREPLSAQSLVFAMLISGDDEDVRREQLRLLQLNVEPPVFDQTRRLLLTLRSLQPASRLPLADLAVPALKRASAQQYRQFRQVICALVKAEGKVGLFEYCLSMMLFSYFDVNFGLKKPAAIRYRSLDAVAAPATVVLSMLAYAAAAGAGSASGTPDGAGSASGAQRAFQAGIEFRFPRATLLAQSQCTLSAFDAALAQLAQTAPKVKQQVLAAVTACIAAGGQVTLEENELLRVIAAVLSCPVPPILPT
jgi:Zn-dependent protease with chaperone function